MNFLLTSVWLILMTILGFNIGVWTDSNSLAWAFGFFVLAGLMRLFPQIIGDVITAID